MWRKAPEGISRLMRLEVQVLHFKALLEEAQDSVVFESNWAAGHGDVGLMRDKADLSHRIDLALDER